MYCKYCGNEISDDSQYCQHCGKLIVKESTSLASSKVDIESSSDVANEEGDTSEDSTYFTISKFVGRMCMYALLLIVLFGILAAVKIISRELFGNYLLFYGALSLLCGIALFKAFKWYKTFSKDAKYFTIAVIFILIASKIGYDVSTNIAEQRMEIEQKKAFIEHINSELPIDIDEKMRWVEVKFETDSIYFEYLTEDSSVDYEISVLDFYQEQFIKNLIKVSNKEFVEHFIEENIKLKFHIISKWDYSKHVDMSLKGVELDYVLKKSNSD